MREIRNGHRDHLRHEALADAVAVIAVVDLERLA
jgi:hypothetical protein